jgi:hypothetical protein
VNSTTQNIVLSVFYFFSLFSPVQRIVARPRNTLTWHDLNPFASLHSSFQHLRDYYKRYKAGEITAEEHQALKKKVILHAKQAGVAIITLSGGIIVVKLIVSHHAYFQHNVIVPIATPSPSCSAAPAPRKSSSPSPTPSLTISTTGTPFTTSEKLALHKPDETIPLQSLTNANTGTSTSSTSPGLAEDFHSPPSSPLVHFAESVKEKFVGGVSKALNNIKKSQSETDLNGVNNDPTTNQFPLASTSETHLPSIRRKSVDTGKRTKDQPPSPVGTPPGTPKNLSQPSPPSPDSVTLTKTPKTPKEHFTDFKEHLVDLKDDVKNTVNHASEQLKKKFATLSTRLTHIANRRPLSPTLSPEDQGKALVAQIAASIPVETDTSFLADTSTRIT